MPTSRSKSILVSSCLLGLDSRYNGVCKKNREVLAFLSDGNWTAIPVCPEQLAGLPTPRPATQFASGDGESVLAGEGALVSSRQDEMSSAFIKGAEQTLLIARLNNCRQAILKERSPSCGVHEVYRNNKVVRGSGVTAAMLGKNGISVYSEDDLENISNKSSTNKG